MPALDLASLESQISTAIGQQETSGGTAGVGLHLNNPGGLKYAPWEAQYGATAAPSGFAQFPSLQNGWQALSDRVNQLVQSGASLNSLMSTWSPPSDGNTNNPARVGQIASSTGLDPTQSISGQAGASGSSPLGTAAGALGSAMGNMVAPGLGGGLPSSGTLSNLTSIAGLATGNFSSWVRVSTAIVGLVCIIAGLFFLKQTGVVIENVQGGADKAKGLAAKIGITAAEA